MHLGNLWDSMGISEQGLSHVYRDTIKLEQLGAVLEIV